MLPSGESRVSLLSKHFSARSVILANEQGLSPSPWPSPPTQKRVGGEGRNCGNADPGPPSGSCRWRRPGLSSDAPLGLYKEEAASCRFTNVESPDEGFRARRRLGPLWGAPARRLIDPAGLEQCSRRRASECRDRATAVGFSPRFMGRGEPNQDWARGEQTRTGLVALIRDLRHERCRPTLVPPHLSVRNQKYRTQQGELPCRQLRQ